MMNEKKKEQSSPVALPAVITTELLTWNKNLGWEFTFETLPLTQDITPGACKLSSRIWGRQKLFKRRLFNANSTDLLYGHPYKGMISMSKAGPWRRVASQLLQEGRSLWVKSVPELPRSPCLSLNGTEQEVLLEWKENSIEIQLELNLK